MVPRRTYLVAVAILTTVVVGLYPYLDGVGACGSGDCPEAQQASYAAPGSFPATCCPAAVLAATPAALAFAGLSRRRVADHRRPAEVHLSPEPRPPRPLF